MTVEGMCSREDNRKKYIFIRKIMGECKKEQAVIMGNMNGHVPRYT